MEILIILSLTTIAGILLYKPKGRRKQIVKKGKSYSISKPTIHLFSRELQGEFRLTPESRYTRDNLQINKITGIAWGHHHLYSIRVGEIINPNGTFTIYVYGYHRGRRFYEPLTVVDPTNGVTLKYKLGNRKGKMFISLYNDSNEPLSSWRIFLPVPPLPGYYNNLYHEDAPSDVVVYNEWY